MKPYSITRRLVSTVLLVELILAGAATGAAMLYERHQHLRSFEVMLRGRADSVMGAVQDAEDQADDVVLDASTLELPRADLYEVLDESGKLLGRSPNWAGAQASGINPTDRHWKLTLGHRHYRGLTLQGVRTIDIDEPGGGSSHRVVIHYASPIHPMDDALWDAAQYLLLANSLLLLGTGIAVVLLLRHAMRPLNLLAAQAAEVSAFSWSFKAPPEAYAARELAPLAAALDGALQRLELSFRQQRNFVSDAAHELKTAVTIVKSSLQLLDYKERSIEEYKQGLAVCLADCGRMEELVQKMLALARAERLGALPASTPVTPTILVHCVRQVIIQLEAPATLRQVHLELSIPEMLAVAVTPEDCATVAKNLILNAVQHSPAGSVVMVSAAGAPASRVQFTVEDKGSGIDPEHLPFLFDRFYRGDPSRSRETGGTGLGLAIVKAIVERYGGAVAMDSQPGKGATVHVLLPAG